MKKLLIFLLSISTIVLTFVSCDFSDFGEKIEEEKKPKPPYELEFTSLGNGTCALTGVYVYKDVSETELVIPDTSPNGERVVSCDVDCIRTSVPTYILKDVFEKEVLGKTESFTELEKMQLEVFFKYYSLDDPKAQNSEIIRDDYLNKYPFLEEIEGAYVFTGATIREFEHISKLIEKTGFDDNAQRAATLKFISETRSTENKYYLANVKFPSNLAPFEEIVVPEGVISVRLSGATNLKKVTLPDGLTKLNDEAFASCENLIEIKMPETVQDIGAAAFYNCLSLSEITIPSSVSQIGDNAFSVCAALHRIVLPQGITKLGSELFGAAVMSGEIEYLFIPNTVTEIAINAFHRAQIQEIEFGGTIDEWNEKFHDRVTVTSVNTIKCSDGSIIKDSN